MGTNSYKHIPKHKMERLYHKSGAAVDGDNPILMALVLEWDAQQATTGVKMCIYFWPYSIYKIR